MRLYPRSMAGRTTLVLIVGLLLILAVGAVVFSLGVLDRHGPRPDIRLIERVATIVSVLDELPAEVRPKAVAKIRRPGLRVRWLAQRPDRFEPETNWFTERLQQQLQRVLSRSGVTEVAVGRIAPGGQSGLRPGRIHVLVKLSDGSWLAMRLGREFHDPRRLVGVILALLILIGGIAGLAIWVSRRLTAPLARFSAAAARLGTDVRAPPMQETGPSEIREAAQAFNQMQERIRRFVEDRTLMLAAISHDLRTALTRLKLRTEFIDDEEQQRKALADLDEMQAMLDATLSFARDDTVSEARGKVDFAALLQSLCDDLADAGLTVRYEGPSRLVHACRPVSLRRAFANLAENAVRYGKEALVTLGDTETEIEVTIADRGPGIPEEMRERVFTPFFRLEESRNRETGGTGLGLAVARSIVRRHGGDIMLDDRPEGGLLVRVTLPKAEG